MTQRLGTTDVIVVGGGPGGLATAIQAAQRGLSVAVIETLSTLGGNLPYSSGYVALADTKLQQASGVDDSPERFLQDLHREVERARDRYGGVFVEAVAETYARASSDVYDWLSAVGVKFRKLIDRPEKHGVPRLHALEDPVDANDALKRELDRHGAFAMTNLRVLRSERSSDTGYRVTLIDQRTGERLEAEAEQGLVVATGGYQANFDMRAEVQPAWLAQSPYLGIPTALGDGHRILASQGARLVNMSFLPPFGHVATSLTEQSLAVNSRGERFHDETDPHQTPVHLEQQPDRRAYYIFDDRTMLEKRSYVTELDRKVETASSIKAVADKLELPATRLETEVELFNDAIRAGDPTRLAVPRTNLPSRPISQPPFHAIEVIVGVSVTYGGARTGANGAVYDAYGEPIPGLFATGNANGSLAPCVEVGGINLGAAMALGWVIGSSVGSALSKTGDLT